MYYEPMTLCHHGIKGQKWGIRRFQNKDGSLTAAGKKRYDISESSKNNKVIQDRKQALANRRTLSDEELKQRIDRLKLEKSFKELSEENISNGKKITKDILSQAGKKVLIGATAGATAYAIKVALTKEFNLKEFAGYVAPNPNKKK